jgi:hypothetical protein
MEVKFRALECLRKAIYMRVQKCDNELIQEELVGKVSAEDSSLSESLWLSCIGEGLRGDGSVSLHVSVQHHIAFHALAIALLHPFRDGFRVPGHWDLRYIIEFDKGSAIAEGLGLAPKETKKIVMKGQKKTPPSETELIRKTFLETVFRGIGSSTSFLPSASAPPVPSTTKRWRVTLPNVTAASESPISKATTVYLPAGAQAFTMNDGRFVYQMQMLTKQQTKQTHGVQADLAGDAAMAMGMEMEEGQEEEMWIMTDDMGTVKPLSQVPVHLRPQHLRNRKK